ncbi:MAG: lysylphosphatidylglycerol synthetase family protein [Sphingobacteriales bacterium]|nr:lysylphosphatidylglycerol synthetase family protein [Sphingobacteriales bacterium]
MNNKWFHKTTAFIQKLYWKEILAVLLLFIAVYFFRHERHELKAIGTHIQNADKLWVSFGLILTAIYILLQAAMYMSAFAAVNANLHWFTAVELFLKRNLLSIFLPAGGVSALAYSPASLRKTHITKIQVHQASAIYAFAGMSTVFIVGLPVLVFAMFYSGNMQKAWIGILLVAVLLASLIGITVSLQKRAVVYRFLTKRFPSWVKRIDELFLVNVNSKKILLSILFSVGVELCGIFHLYIAMKALHEPAALSAASIAYIVSIVLMVISPFLRGLGAVELSLVYILSTFGYTEQHGLAISVLYRLFEFWLPLAAGIIAFAMKGRQLFMRLMPALMIFILGVVNILSVVTPPIAERLKLAKEFLPVSSIHASNLLVIFIGAALFITAAFLIRGFRSAWIIALVLAILSLVGHLTKALDYEEAIIAFIAIVVLLFTSKEYRTKSNPRLVRLGISTALLVFVAVFIFGTVGFYFIDVRHFGVDFTWKQSLGYAAGSFLLLQNPTLHPVTRFGREFMVMISALGFLSWGFFFYTLIRPYIFHHSTSNQSLEKAKFYLSQYGSSAVDFFKVYPDKLLFISNEWEGFIAYRIANGFAIVLEEPVSAGNRKTDILKDFEQHCRRMGLKTAFYRVDENSMHFFESLNKKKLFIGQEAIVDVTEFKLEGKDRKSLRNGLNSLQKKGYTTILSKAPQSIELLEELKIVSDEWLINYDKAELIFSQGMFDAGQLQVQDIILVRDETNKVVAFLNIIPDFTPEECTYDMIRKTADAPGGCMDALIVELINYAKENNLRYINLGLVPMTGFEKPDSTAERIVKFAAEKIKRYRHYRGQRSFKEKYASEWLNKYLVYENDFDLIRLPAALNKVMQPE